MAVPEKKNPEKWRTPGVRQISMAGAYACRDLDSNACAIKSLAESATVFRKIAATARN
jgi:hypothetical protein